MHCVFNRKTNNAQAISPLGRNFGFFCRDNIINDFSFYTQDNIFVDIISTFHIRTLIDINNNRIPLTRRQYSELKSLELQLSKPKKSKKFDLIGSFIFVPFRLITIESQDSWLITMGKLLHNEVLCNRKHLDYNTHAHVPLTSSQFEFSFIEFYNDHDCDKLSNFKYIAMLNLLFSQVEMSLHRKNIPCNSSTLEWDFSDYVKKFIGKVITMIRRMDNNMDNRTLLLRIS